MEYNDTQTYWSEQIALNLYYVCLYICLRYYTIGEIFIWFSDYKDSLLSKNIAFNIFQIKKKIIFHTQ